jgi:hypothetical protein
LTVKSSYKKGDITMAYAQWAKILIKSKSVDLAITHFNLYYGKFHADNNKEHEIKIAHNQTLLIPENGELLPHG